MSSLLRLCAGLCVLVAAGGTFISGSEISSPLRVAQCRATCLKMFANGPDRASQCLQGPDCFMCWENCELLQSNFAVWGVMCAEKDICYPGCQQACRFHRETARAHQLQPVIHTRGDEVVRISGAVASWPRPPTSNPSSPLVYVVVARARSSSWRQLVQTVDLSARLPTDTPVTMRVLVVDPEGLVTIYSPVPMRAPGPLSTALGLGKVMQGQRKKINTEIIPSTTRTPALGGDWQLRQISLIHQKVLVIAEVAWQPRAARAVYLVTWEVDGGGLKGNLFTDSTSVTLSLWPDTIYHIQVELVSRTAEHQTQRSASLVIDTHRAEQVAIEATFLAAAALNRDRRPSSTPPPPPPPPAPVDSKFRPELVPAPPAISSPLLSVLVKRSDLAEVSDRRRQLELLAGGGSAVLLFIVVLAVAAWRCRHSAHSSLRVGASAIRPKKLVEDKVVVTATPAPTPAIATTSSFLAAAERGARNEVQV